MEKLRFFSASDINNEKAFEREINLCQDFQREEQNKNDDLQISLNVSRDMMVIWVHFDKTWDVHRDIKILNELLISRNLDKVGYQIPWTALEYSACEWDNKKKICEYTCKCPKFDFEIFFNDVEYRDFDDT